MWNYKCIPSKKVNWTQNKMVSADDPISSSHWSWIEYESLNEQYTRLLTFDTIIIWL